MQPPSSLDTWTSGFLLAVGMGLFLFLLLILEKNKKNRPIALFVLAFSVILFQYVLYWTRYEIQFPYLQLLPSLCYYVTGPLIYLYFLNLYKKKVRFNYMLHFFPALLIVIPNVVLWLKYLGWIDIKIPLLFLVQQYWFIVAHMSIYSLLIFRLIFSNNENGSQYGMMRKRWGMTLATLYSLFIAAYTSYYLLVQFPFFNAEWDYMISIMMTVSIYAIGYFIFKQPAVFDGEFYSRLFLPKDEKKDNFETALLNELYQNLTNYMEREKPYTDNELRLVNLADQLGFSTHLLSKVINKKSGKNFNKFVNEYRLREAERLLSETSQPSIKSVYFDVGFNSKAAFYNAFKRKHNCTPSQFRARLSGS
ncbi:MAG: helix-turn-helix domain-containing protein [Bacteroidota bacterium]